VDKGHLAILPIALFPMAVYAGAWVVSLFDELEYRSAVKGCIAVMKVVGKPDFCKWVGTGIVLLINILLWAIPGNVAYLVAQNRDVLLGRYSVSRLTVQFLLVPVSVLAIYLIWSSEKNKRERQFKVITLCISVIASMIVMDLFVRLAQPQRYILHKSYFHRPPNTVRQGTARDVPEKAFLYPRTPAGYPDIEYTLTVDKRGFRNKTDLEKYDVVTLGDSFTEGSNISDEQTWPALLAQKGKLTVYNLGMSAGNPPTYLETLQRFGLQLSPKIVICMLYEGNDFRESNFENRNRLGYHLYNYYRASPVRRALQDLLIRCFSSTTVPDVASSGNSNPGSIAGDESASGEADDLMKAVSWLPIAIPDGNDGKYYSFQVKKLLDHFEVQEDFLRSKGCRETFAVLHQLKKICGEKNIRLVVAYAPDKPHVLMPLLKHRVSAEQLYAFMSLKEKNLPPAGELMETVLARLEVQESVLKRFCENESIEFVGLTQPLRETISGCRQAYFTYDQHWTPLGHEVVADTLCRYIEK